MNELAKAFRGFLGRDLVYIFGGSTVILAFLYFFDRLPKQNLPIALWGWGVAAAYVLGYAIQEFFSILRITAPTFVVAPNSFLEWCYRRFLGGNEKLPEGKLPDIYRVTAITFGSTPEGARDFFERSMVLRQMGTAAGPSLFLTGSILTLKSLCQGHCVHCDRAFDWTLAITVLLTAVLLMLMSWIKSIQLARHAQYLLRRYGDKLNDEPPTQPPLILAKIFRR